MKKLFTIVAMIMAFYSTSYAQNDSSLFNAKEVGVSVGTGYVLDTSEPFQDIYGLNFSGGLSYFLTRNLGIETWVPFYTSKGVSVQEVQAGVLLRVPLSYDMAVWKNLAPYVGLGGVYNWETDSQWSYVAKLGTEFRLNKKWGVGLEGQYRNNHLTDLSQGQVNLFGYLKLVF